MTEELGVTAPKVYELDQYNPILKEYTYLTEGPDTAWVIFMLFSENLEY